MAFAESSDNSFGLTIEPLGTSVDHVTTSFHTHHCDMRSSLHVIQGCYDSVELPEELDIEVSATNTIIKQDYLLDIQRFDLQGRVQLESSLASDLGLVPAHVRLAEYKLPIEIGFFNDVQIQDSEPAKARLRQVLE